jgi:uncharacterized RDD family membrane protein YckC
MGRDRDREKTQMNDASNPFAPPVAEVADVVPQGAQVLGSRGARFGAAIIDVAIQLAVVLGAAFALGWMGDESLAGVLRLTLLSFGFFFAAHGWLLLKRGQTIGKALVGLRIVRPDGSPPSAGRLIGLRYVVGTIPTAIPVVGVFYGIVDALLIFRASRRCLHDSIADTIVVRA